MTAEIATALVTDASFSGAAKAVQGQLPWTAFEGTTNCTNNTADQTPNTRIKTSKKQIHEYTICHQKNRTPKTTHDENSSENLYVTTPDLQMAISDAKFELFEELGILHNVKCIEYVEVALPETSSHNLVSCHSNSYLVYTHICIHTSTT
jgi:hypothetical protein